MKGFVVLTCTIAACGSADASGSAGLMSTSAGRGADMQDDFKGCPADGPRFEPGIRASGKSLSLKLIAAQPTEPERYENAWDVELASLDGTPAADATLVRGQTFMPIHGHDGRVEPVITTLPSPGQRHVARLNFSMRGPWEVRFWLRSAQGEDDYAVFKVCVAK